jgi:hypothetical protein
MPSASVPATAGKDCGIANTMPTIANVGNVALSTPQAKPRGGYRRLRL